MKTRIMIVLALLAVSGTAYAEDAAAEQLLSQKYRQSYGVMPSAEYVTVHLRLWGWRGPIQGRAIDVLRTRAAIRAERWREAQPRAVEPESALTDSPSAPEYVLETAGMHAGKMTRDRDAIRAFDPVGVWSVPEDETVNSPTIGFMYVYPDGSMVMLAADDCRTLSRSRWEFDYGRFTIIETDGEKTDTYLAGVPGKVHEQEDGSLVYGWGQVVLFDTARYWYFMGADVTADC